MSRKTIIIRDDDTSFFTSPDLLERIYGKLWEYGHPVCLSVVPAHNANVRVTHRPGNPIDPSVARIYRGQDHDFSIRENIALCAFLKAQYERELVEICLHGYNHAYMEFGTQDQTVIEDKLAAGRRIFDAAFADVPITTFIAPYDNLSQSALRAVLDSGYNISTMPDYVRALPELDLHGGYQHLKTTTGRHIFTCEEYVFNHREDPMEALAKVRNLMESESFLVITNHYWAFFHDWNGPTPLLDAWDQFVADLLSTLR